MSGGIEEFTVWFDFGLYNNLVVTTPETPPEWDQIVWQVEPVLEDPGGYDAVATNLSIDIGESLSGFSVSFDWLGTGEPASQFYEVIDPLDFSTIEDGYTVPEPTTQIWYETSYLGPGLESGERWQYTYDVYNISLIEEIEEFTIWFGIGSYDNLAIETLDPPASNWDEIVWDPEPFLGDDGGYDALAESLNIGVGENVYGFAVSFDWLGIGEPGSQYYEIIDPGDFHTIEDGYTVPEPAALLLLGLGMVMLRRKR